MNSRRVSLLLLLGLLSVAFLQAQRQRFSTFGFVQKADPETEFAIVRWYSAGWDGDGWSHDYPIAEEHLLQVMKEVSLIDTDRLSYKVVDLANEEIFKYPFSYVSHPGEVYPSDKEIANLRQYIERGGFVIWDDFGGQK